jgi:hypothetical protein
MQGSVYPSVNSSRKPSLKVELINGVNIAHTGKHVSSAEVLSSAPESEQFAMGERIISDSSPLTVKINNISINNILRSNYETQTEQFDQIVKQRKQPRHKDTL